MMSLGNDEGGCNEYIPPEASPFIQHLQDPLKSLWMLVLKGLAERAEPSKPATSRRCRKSEN
jgi:hypothetical protein